MDRRIGCCHRVLRTFTGFAVVLGGGAQTDVNNRIIALLGRKDLPVDGVEDYCRCLAEALARRQVSLELVHVDWDQLGWLAALRKLWRQAAGWRGSWVVLQYTALAWSRRGFPLGAVIVLWVLRRHGARAAIVFHEPFRQGGGRSIDKIRGCCQDWVIRRLYAGTSKCIFPDPLQKISWLPSGSEKAFFIPIGANLPEDESRQHVGCTQAGAAKTVVVFCVSSPPYRRRELEDIAFAMKFAKQQGLHARVVFVGRGTAEAQDEINTLFGDAGIEAINLGLQDPSDVRRILSSADAMLCVRGSLYMRRGSAIAGIACGLPIVAYAGEAEGTPLAEAGVELVPYGDKDALARTLALILMSPERQRLLRSRSRETQQRYFSWHRIAELYLHIFEPSAAFLKLLIYSQVWAPSIGGVQSYVMSLARGIACRPTGGIGVTLVTHTPRSEMDDSVLRFRVVRRPSRMQVFRLVKDSDVIHLAGAALLPLAFASLLRKPVVVEHSGYQAICPNGLLIYGRERTLCPGYFMRKRYHKCVQCQSEDLGRLKSMRATALTLLRRWLTKRAAVNVAPSRHVAARVALPRTELIYHGVASKQPQLTPNSAQERPFYFAFSGRLVPEKGADILLRAAHELAQSGLDFRIRIVGDGPERKRLERMSAEMGLLPLIEFTGAVPFNVVDQALSSAEAVVMPSTWEDVAPLVVPEQMMQGRLLIASDIGGLGETVGDFGLRFPAGDAGALAACMRYVMENPEAARELRERARRHANEIHAEHRMVEAHAALYQSISHFSRRGPSVGVQNAER